MEMPAAPNNEENGDTSKSKDSAKAEKTSKPKLPDLKDMDLTSADPVFVEYQVTQADMDSVGKLPKTVPEMAKLKWMPYATLPEALAEKFHCDLDFLAELNSGKLAELKAGDTLKVPNVEPFDVNAVKDMPLLDLTANSEEKKKEKKPAGKGKDKPKTNAHEDADTRAEAKAETGDEKLLDAAEISVKVNTEDNMLRLFEKGRLVAAFPVTIGSTQTQSPTGDWKVRGIARLPDFRYDESFLKTGERGDKTYLLQPGPNNMVGVIWIALDKSGIGLHGTSEPDSIGRSASHGCVRLANWDIVRLASRLRARVEVAIH